MEASSAAAVLGETAVAVLPSDATRVSALTPAHHKSIVASEFEVPCIEPVAGVPHISDMARALRKGLSSCCREPVLAR